MNGWLAASALSTVVAVGHAQAATAIQSDATMQIGLTIVAPRCAPTASGLRCPSGRKLFASAPKATSGVQPNVTIRPATATSPALVTYTY